MKLELSKEQSKAWHRLNDNYTSEVFFGGAAGGGKSWFGCLWHIISRVKYPESRGLIGRAKISNLEQSTLITYFKVAKELGYIQGEHFKYNSQKHTITWLNGSQTILKDLFHYPSDPDFISLGSTEYTDAFIDEAPEITLRAFELVNSRIRWKLHDYGLIPKMFLTGNPSPCWVKDRYVSKDNQPVILQNYQCFIPALLSSNPDKQFRELYEKQLSQLTSDYDKQRLLYGDWDSEREVTNPFLTQYDKVKHESELAVFNPNRQLRIVIDFNINPFCLFFAHLWRDEQGEHCHIFDEMAIQGGSIPKIAEQIRIKYSKHLHNCLITGDAMGNRGSIESRDNASLYMQLIRELGLRKGQVQVSNNPTHENSRGDCNYILYHFPDFKINPKTCPNTVRDCKVVQCDGFGKIIKSNRSRTEQQADFLDNVRYLIHNWLTDWIKRHK
jgi:phage terminase large subunit